MNDHSPELTAPHYDGTVVLQSFDDFVARVTLGQPCAHWIYRGVKDAANHRLVPTLGRLKKFLNADADERARIERGFIESTLSASNPSDPNFNYGFAIAVAAQHHGAPTRLLDWTDSPLIAAYFACEPKLSDEGSLIEPSCDAAIYATHCCPDEITDFRNLDYPWANSEIGTYSVRPPIASERVASQLSVFTVQCDPVQPMELQPSKLITRIDKLTIPVAFIPDFRRRLHRLGIRKRGIFPDADGVNSSIVVDDALNDELAGLCQAGSS